MKSQERQELIALSKPTLLNWDTFEAELKRHRELSDKYPDLALLLSEIDKRNEYKGPTYKLFGGE